MKGVGGYIQHHAWPRMKPIDLCNTSTNVLSCVHRTDCRTPKKTARPWGKAKRRRTAKQRHTKTHLGCRRSHVLAVPSAQPVATTGWLYLSQSPARTSAPPCRSSWTHINQVGLANNRGKPRSSSLTSWSSPSEARTSTTVLVLILPEALQEGRPPGQQAVDVAHATRAHTSLSIRSSSPPVRCQFERCQGRHLLLSRNVSLPRHSPRCRRHRRDC